MHEGSPAAHVLPGHQELPKFVLAAAWLRLEA
jgi:hypothetical protein